MNIETKTSVNYAKLNLKILINFHCLKFNKVALILLNNFLNVIFASVMNQFVKIEFFNIVVNEFSI